MITTTQCEHCGGAVEFELDQWQEGAVGDCPHCHQVTQLRRNEIYTAPPVMARNRSEAGRQPPALPRWKPGGNTGEIFVCMGGVVLLVLGGGVFGTASNAINEVAAVVIGCTGCLMIGMAVLIAAVRNLAEKP